MLRDPVYSFDLTHVMTSLIILAIGLTIVFRTSLQIGLTTGTWQTQTAHVTHKPGSIGYVAHVLSVKHPIVHRTGLALPLHSC